MRNQIISRGELLLKDYLKFRASIPFWIPILAIFAIGVGGYIYGIALSIEFLFLVSVISTAITRVGLAASLMPFYFIFLVYTNLRRIALLVTPIPVHVTELIVWEQKLFGEKIPTVFLQEEILRADLESEVNLLANIFYLSYFFIPIVVAIFLYTESRRKYWVFMAGMLSLTFLGYLVYILYPAAPPWWANYFGYLKLPNPDILPISELFKIPNPVAAMPSLHAAHTTYAAGMAVSNWKRKHIRTLLLIPLLVSISAVYLGHHYVIDILAGVFLGVFCVRIFAPRLITRLL